MAANDADDAYVMDLSDRHLSSRGLHEALVRLTQVLDEEDAAEGFGGPPRALELLCAGARLGESFTTKTSLRRSSGGGVRTHQKPKAPIMKISS